MLPVWKRNSWSTFPGNLGMVVAMCTRLYRLIPIATVTIGLLGLSLAQAGPHKKRRSHEFIFLLTDVEQPNQAPSELGEQLSQALHKQIDTSDNVHQQIPSDAPPRTAPKEFAAYLKANRLHAYAVNIEVTNYSSDIEEPTESKARALTVKLELRMFGETIPKRVMAFSGKGEATVKIEVGSKVRDKDRNYAVSEAVKEAMQRAYAESIAKLEAKWNRGKRKKRTKVSE